MFSFHEYSGINIFHARWVLLLETIIQKLLVAAGDFSLVNVSRGNSSNLENCGLLLYIN